MQERSCYNCESDKNTFYASENGFALVKCSECGLLFVNPCPTSEKIEQAHKLGVHRGSAVLNVTGRFNHSRVAGYLEVLEDIFENGLAINKKTWLDIGCGHGEFLVALLKFSKGQVVAKGIEPNEYKQKSAQKKGLDVSYFDLDKHSEKYDVISLLNVYSHLPDPPVTILSWKRLLKPGGELLLQTGDTANFDGKDHYRPFYLPDHLSFASESIVVSILERTGFEVLDIKKYPHQKLTLNSLIKEIVKVFWPNKKSRLRSMIKHKMYANTNMYILAKLKG
jgi:2-polyprenyl-3-methyl-5-hydroxy-6-metoxy-1,4-benzoquinol methylase